MFKYENFKNILTGLSWRAFPNLIHSNRSGNDRQVSDPRTRNSCENKPEEIGWLLKNLTDKEIDDLKDIKDLKFVENCDDTIRENFMVCNELKSKNSTKRKTYMNGIEDVE